VVNDAYEDRITNRRLNARKSDKVLDKPILFAATADADRSREFYESVLELRFVADEPYALVFDVDGVMLRIQKVPEFAAAAHTVLGWSVQDIDATVKSLTSKGVRFNRYEHMQQGENGVWQAPGGGKVAWFNDPDDNTLSLTQG